MALSAELVGTKLCAGRVSSISTLHVDSDQHDPKTHPIALTLRRARGRQGQPRGSAAACFGGVSPKNTSGRPKGQP